MSTRDEDLGNPFADEMDDGVISIRSGQASEAAR